MCKKMHRRKPPKGGFLFNAGQQMLYLMDKASRLLFVRWTPEGCGYMPPFDLGFMSSASLITVTGYLALGLIG
jgi:hypothetical protein